jgi:carboxyl-terminal processing protease
MKKLFVTLLFAVLGFANAQIQSPARDLFDQASFVVEFNYNGFSTQNLTDLIAKYSTQLDTACGTDANCPFETARPLVAAMLDDLKDDHTGYANPTAYQSYLRQSQGGGVPQAIFGMSIIYNPTAKQFLVVDVYAGAAADQAGLQRADVITSLNGQPVPDAEPAARTKLSELAQLGGMVDVGILRGTPRAPQVIKIAPRIINFTNLPSMRRYPQLPDDVSLMRIPTFSGTGIAQKVHDLARDVKTPKLILDLRGNPGGRDNECIAASGAFVDNVNLKYIARRSSIEKVYKDGQINTKRGSSTSVELKLNNPARYTGKVVVLVDAMSASCAELMPAALQFEKRGPIIGEATTGVGNTATTFFAMLDGSAVQLTIVQTRRLDDTPYPAALTPDINVPANLQDLFETGKDAILERAVAELK